MAGAWHEPGPDRLTRGWKSAARAPALDLERPLIGSIVGVQKYVYDAYGPRALAARLEALPPGNPPGGRRSRG
jgi:hypothetical protein